MAGVGNLFALMAMPGTTTVFGIATNSFFGRLMLSVAASALQTALTPKPRAPGIKTSTTASGGTNPCSFIIGDYATGGYMACPAMSHSRPNKNRNLYLTYVIELGDIPGQTLKTLFIDGNEVEIGTEAHADYGLPILGTYEGYAWIKYYDGSQTVADQMLLDKYGDSPDRPWMADMVGIGLCYAILTFRFKREIYNSLPRVRFEMGGIPLYDPRYDSSVGGIGPQRWADKSTWGSSTNLAVQIYNIKRGIELPDGNVWGGQVPAEDLPLDVWFAAMNECDLSIDLEGGGSEAQWRASLEVSVDEEPSDVIEELLKGCGGRVAEVGGVWSIRIGAAPLPVYFFTDGDVIVSKAQELAPFPAMAQIYNGVQATFPDPESGWETTDAPGRYSPEYEAQDLGKRLVADLSLPAVPYDNQVQRVMLAYSEEQRRFRRHIQTLRPQAAMLEPLDVIAWTSARNGYDGKLFELSEQANSVRTCLQRVSMREVDPSDYDWEPGFTLPSTPAPGGWGLPAPQAVEGFGADGVALSDASSTARRPAIYLTWDADLGDTSSGIRWGIRLAASAQVVLRGSTQDVAGGGYVVSDGVLPATDYQVRAQLVQSAPAEWTDWVSVTTPDVRMGEADLPQSILDEIATARAEAQAADAHATQVLADADAAVAELRVDVVAAVGDLARPQTLTDELADARSDLADASAAAAGATAALRNEIEAAVGDLGNSPPLIDQVGSLDTGMSQRVADIERIDRDLELRIPREVEASNQLRLIAGTVSDLLIRLSQTQTDMADAGIYIDPAQGRARIEAVARIDQTLSEVSITLDALASSIELRATHSEVSQAVTNAVLDPSQIPVLDDLQAQVNTVVLALDALNAAIELKAESVTIDGLTASLTQAGLDIDAIEASLSQFVTQTTFDALGSQVTTVEQALSGFDGAQYQLALSDIRAIGGDQDLSAIASLEALIAAHEGREVLRVDLAYINQNMRALVDEDRVSIASLRTDLGVAFDQAQALIETETTARATADEALALNLVALDARLTGAEGQADGNATAITSLSARITETETGIVSLSSDLMQLDARITDAETDLTGTALAVSALDARVTQTEGGLEVAASDRRQITASVVEADAAGATASLRALLGDASAREALHMGMADARDDFYARVREGEEAIAGQLVELTAALGDAVALVTQEVLARTSAVDAEATARLILAAELADAQAALISEQTARASADAAAAGRLDAVEVSVGDNVAGIATETQARTDADSALAGQISTVQAATDANAAAITAETVARTDADTALAGQITTVQAASDANATAITSEALARVGADSALGVRLDTIEATTAANAAAISSEITARTDADSALAGQIVTVQATTDDNAAAIATETTARTDADTALAGQIATISTATGDNAAAITAETVARTDGDSALAGQITSLTASVNASFSGVSTDIAALVAEDGALASRLDAVEATTDDNAAAIATETTARTDADTALAGQIATISTATGDNAAAITAETVARTDGDSALAGQITNLTASVNASFAGISTDLAALVDEGGALAGRLDTVEATAGDLTASVSTQATAIATLDGHLSSTLAFRTVAGSGGASLELVSSSDPSGDASVARITAGNILLDGSVYAQHLAAGTITADRIAVADLAAAEAFLNHLTVDTLNIAGQAVTVPVRMFRAGKVDVNSDTTWTYLGGVWINRRGVATEISFSCTLDGYGSGSVDFGVFRNGTQIRSAAQSTGDRGRQGQVTFVTVDFDTDEGGTWYELRARKSNPNVTSGWNANCRVWRRYISATQFRR
ncbi:hypothetical protein [Thalassovita sp.]|uniref:hypothetical protein n=1 Tax=Thalassovita sp. TaxID=1979401 RepID=UPI002881D298|nr:hypothetical protein [Thalassovita sp.]MDF1804062.1 hypothetical protein [Thalassovita sp.]